MCNKIEIHNVEVSYIIGKHLFDYKTCLFALITLIKTKNVIYICEFYYIYSSKILVSVLHQLSFKNVTYLFELKFNCLTYYHKERAFMVSVT